MAAATTRKTKANGEISQADVEAGLKQVKSDIAELTKTLSQYGQSQVSAAGTNAKQKKDELLLQSEQALEDLRMQVKSLTEQAETKVREKPIQSLLIAAGIGAALTFIARR